MSYPLKMRVHILSVKEREGLSDKQTSERFNVSIRSLKRWHENPYPKAKRNKPATKIDMDALSQDIQDNPDAYQYERASRFGVSTSGIAKAMKRLKVTRKKNSYVIRKLIQK